jgi:hypothetical protein
VAERVTVHLKYSDETGSFGVLFLLLSEITPANELAEIIKINVKKVP